MKVMSKLLPVNMAKSYVFNRDLTYESYVKVTAG